MKQYLQRDLNDPTKTVLVWRTRPDQYTIGEAPEGAEHAGDIDEVDDVMEYQSPVYELDEDGNIKTKKEIRKVTDMDGNESEMEFDVPIQKLDERGEPVFETVQEVVGKKLVVNEAKRQERVTRETQEREQKESAQEQARLKREAAQNRINEFKQNPAAANSVARLRAVIEDLVELLQ